MPLSLTYPGVYVDELPSGVRTITGVSTSVTAFVGNCLRGPLDKPILINSFADFERIFGGLTTKSQLGYAVQDFYLNGGTKAIIVRVFETPGSTSFADNTAKIETITASGNNFLLEAANPGKWGNNLQVVITNVSNTDIESSFGVPAGSLFNLTVTDTATGAKEQFLNVTVIDSPRRIDNVLLNSSNLLRVRANGLPLNGARPQANTTENPSYTVEPTGNEGQDSDELTSAIVKGNPVDKTGVYALENADIFNLLCIPPFSATESNYTNILADVAVYCEKRRAFFIIDAPSSWNSKDNAIAGIKNSSTSIPPLGLNTKSKNAAVFFPRIKKPNPLRNDQIEEFAPCGAVAGVMARIDAERGIWKAPAGLEANSIGVTDLTVSLTNEENGDLNPLGINCLRMMPAAGPVIWGSRTLQGNDSLASEWKYIPVRRLALYIEESLYRGIQWAVFEPNDEPLWRQLALNVDNFMHTLYRQGAFQGKTQKEAYFVKCDHETTTQTDIDLGIVNILVGFAPLKPAEFVVLKLQQIAGQTQS